MESSERRKIARKSRHNRIRKKISGTATKPRLAVFRSSKHIYVQAIDDLEGKTLAASSTIALQKSLKSSTGNKGSAKDVGKDLADKLKKISGDASFREFYRLKKGNKTSIIVQANKQKFKNKYLFQKFT